MVTIDADKGRSEQGAESGLGQLEVDSSPGGMVCGLNRV